MARNASAMPTSITPNDAHAWGHGIRMPIRTGASLPPGISALPQPIGMPLTRAWSPAAGRPPRKVDKPDVQWVLFAVEAIPYDHQKESEAAVSAQATFESWCGPARLSHCLQTVPRP